MNRSTRSAILLPAMLLCGCAQIDQLDYATACARSQPYETRSAIVRDLCQQFGKRGSVQLYGSGDTVACSVTISETPIRMFVYSKDASSLMKGSSVAYISLSPWKAPAEIVIDAPADDHALAEEVTRAVEQSLGKSGCSWVVHQHQYRDAPKLG